MKVQLYNNSNENVSITMINLITRNHKNISHHLLIPLAAVYRFGVKRELGTGNWEPGKHWRYPDARTGFHVHAQRIIIEIINGVDGVMNGSEVNRFLPVIFYVLFKCFVALKMMDFMVFNCCGLMIIFVQAITIFQKFI